MSKEIFFDKEARTKIIAGAGKMAKAVGSTLGPFGRNVIIKKEYNDPHITKDGVTVADHIRFKDQMEDIGALLVRQAARNTANNSGDGTTTTTLMAYQLMKSALDSKDIWTIRQLKTQLDYWLSKVIEYIDDETIPFSDDVDIVRHVSMISSNGDEDLTNAIVSCYKELGNYADIVIDTSPKIETHHEIFSGMYFEGGYIAREFINVPSRESCEMTNVALLITERKISDPADIVEIVRKLLASKFSVLIIAPEVSGDALLTLARTVQNKKQNICVIRSPSVNVRRADMMEDIAVFTGGQVVKSNLGRTLTEAVEGMKFGDYIGQAKKVVIRKDSTTIISGGGDKDAIQERVKVIQNNSDAIEDTLLKKRYQKRISGLQSGVGIIYVGGSTEVEIKEKKDRLDDCVCAVRSASEEGVVLGGGSIFSEFVNMNEEELDACPVGRLIKETLLTPINYIWKINGEREIPDNYLEYLEENHILDPVKVLKDCIRNSFSVAYSVISSNATIINDDESDQRLGDLPSFEDVTN